MNGVFDLDPVDLVRHEAFAEHGIGIDFDGGKDGGHREREVIEELLG